MQCFVFILLFFASIAHSQTLLKVSSDAWNGLTSEEKSLIQSRYIIESVNSDSYGTIIDNQGVNESTPGTNSGARLGEAVASASYIDKAFNNGNYSAKNHLGALILGGLIGSALDSKPQSQYHFRYAVKLGNGNIAYHDITSSDPFRHPAGVCILLPSVNIAPEQHLCNQTTDSLRSAHISTETKPIQQQSLLSSTSITQTKIPQISPNESDSNNDLITCKLNSLAPVKTTSDKCNLINGVIVK